MLRCIAETIISFRVQHRTRSQSPNCSNDSIHASYGSNFLRFEQQKRPAHPGNTNRPSGWPILTETFSPSKKPFTFLCGPQITPQLFKWWEAFTIAAIPQRKSLSRSLGSPGSDLSQTHWSHQNTSGAFTVSEAYVPRARMFEGDQSIVADANLKFKTGIRTTADQFGPFTSSVCPSRLLVLLAWSLCFARDNSWRVIYSRPAAERKESILGRLIPEPKNIEGGDRTVKAFER